MNPDGNVNMLSAVLIAGYLDFPFSGSIEGCQRRRGVTDTRRAPGTPGVGVFLCNLHVAQEFCCTIPLLGRGSWKEGRGAKMGPPGRSQKSRAVIADFAEFHPGPIQKSFLFSFLAGKELFPEVP